MASPHNSLSRRSLVAQMIYWPARLAGLSAIIGAVPLATTGCGESRVTGPTDQKVQKQPKPQSDTNLNEGTRQDTDELPDPEDLADSSEQSPASEEPEMQKAPPRQSLPSEDLGNKGNTVATLVQGARPNGGFFSRGAPQLTKAQIEAGNPIEATCEGTNHKLTITSEHLAQLAEGKTVQVKSATNTHFGNPTVHNHSVTYTPIKA